MPPPVMRLALTSLTNVLDNNREIAGAAKGNAPIYPNSPHRHQQATGLPRIVFKLRDALSKQTPEERAKAQAESNRRRALLDALLSKAKS